MPVIADFPWYSCYFMSSPFHPVIRHLIVTRVDSWQRLRGAGKRIARFLELGGQSIALKVLLQRTQTLAAPLGAISRR